jgi:hypothetical protein
MAKIIHTGGPAFPRAGKEWGNQAWTEAMAEDGMSLRDYFAAKQMHALVTMLYLGPEDSQRIAELAYMQADAMLEVRKS